MTNIGSLWKKDTFWVNKSIVKIKYFVNSCVENGNVQSEKLIVANFSPLPKEYKSMTRLWKWMESAWWVSHRILLQQFSETPRAMSGKYVALDMYNFIT